MGFFTKVKNSLSARSAGFARKVKLVTYPLSKSSRKIRKFKDKYLGKRCFIIGNGPSLRAEDLDKLKGEYCFAANRVYKIFDKTDWRPTFFCSEDYKTLEACVDEINALPCEHKFISIACHWDMGINIKGAKYFLLKYDDIENIPPQFSRQVDKFISWGNTITYTSIQLAVHMGFKEIYLLGVDHSFSVYQNLKGEVIKDENAKDYFCEDYNKDKDKLFVPTPERSELAYMAAQAFANSSDVKIYNATRGGKLEVFPRVNFDDIEF